MWQFERDIRFAQVAVVAYIESTKLLRSNVEYFFVADRLERALGISMQIKSGVPEPYRAAVDAIWGFIEELSNPESVFVDMNDACLLERLVQLVCNYKLESYPLCAKSLEKSVAFWLSAPNLTTANAALMLMAECYRLAEDRENQIQSYRRAVDCLLGDAEVSNPWLAQHQLQEAIGLLKDKIPNTKPERIELQAKLHASQKAIMSQLSTAFCHQVSIPTAFMEQSRMIVKRKTVKNALKALASIVIPPINSHTTESNTFLGFVSSEWLSDKALVQGKGVAQDGVNSYIWYMSRETFAVCKLQPCFEYLSKRSTKKLTDGICSTLSECSFIPAGHEVIWGYGIVAGLRGDYLTALHLLVPQLESYLRHLLTIVGLEYQSFKVRNNNVQDEIFLDEALQNSTICALIGPDLREEMVRVFGCSEAGYPNLRNRLCHGLVKMNDLKRPLSHYAFWLIMKLVLDPTIHRRIRESLSS